MSKRNYELEPPGAGLPGGERFFLNAAFKTGTAITSAKGALKLFKREWAELNRIADEDDQSYDIFEQKLIPRVMGIEDSSRNWSVLMILEHLCMVNTDILRIVKALVDEIVPRGELDIALYKPSNQVDFDTINRFIEINSNYVRVIEELIERRGNLRTMARYPHPWFGKIDAHQWNCLAGIHQRIHRRQAQKLVAMLGVT